MHSTVTKVLLSTYCIKYWLTIGIHYTLVSLSHTNKGVQWLFEVGLYPGEYTALDSIGLHVKYRPSTFFMIRHCMTRASDTSC